jgi:hypothetical protein
LGGLERNGPEWGDVRFKRDEVLKLWRRNSEGTIAAGGGGQPIAVDGKSRITRVPPVSMDDTRPASLESREISAIKLGVESGYITRHLVDDSNEGVIELIDPYILLHEEKLSAFLPMLPLLEAVAQSGRPFLIIAQDVERDLLATLVVNNKRGALKVAAVRAPGFGDRREAIMHDIAQFTGGMLVNDSLGIVLEGVTLNKLGTAKKVVIDRDKTTIFGGGGRPIEPRSARSTADDPRPERLPNEVVTQHLPVGHTATISSRGEPQATPPREGRHNLRPTRRRKSPRERLIDALIQIHLSGMDINHGSRDELHSLALEKAGIGTRSRGNSRPTFERALATAIDRIAAH